MENSEKVIYIGPSKANKLGYKLTKKTRIDSNEEKESISHFVTRITKLVNQIKTCA